MVDDSPCGGLLMVKKEHHAKFYRQLELNKSRQCRYLDYASFTIHDLNIAVASVHLDSVFFSKNATDFKVAQLKQVCNKLNAIKPDCMLIAGDMNFTSGDQLENENAAIKSLGLSDLWKSAHTTTEDENDQSYRDNDITWDSANNPSVEYPDEFQRPDRIFMGLFKPEVKVEMERRVSSESDHYGLKAKLSF